MCDGINIDLLICQKAIQNNKIRINERTSKYLDLGCLYKRMIK